MDCPRCGAQTTSHHECYPPERELHGGWCVSEPKPFDPPQYQEPLGPPLQAVTSQARWQHVGGMRWRGEYAGMTVEVWPNSWCWKFEVRRDGKLLAGDLGDYSDVERVKWQAMLAARECSRARRSTVA